MKPSLTKIAFAHTGFLVLRPLADFRVGGTVVNCMGNGSDTAGDARGSYSNNRGEVVLFKECPVDIPFYIIDDDNQIGVCDTRPLHARAARAFSARLADAVPVCTCVGTTSPHARPSSSCLTRLLIGAV